MLSDAIKCIKSPRSVGQRIFRLIRVFLDVQMPLVNGFAFIEKVGAENLP